jgi:hypothetical protein
MILTHSVKVCLATRPCDLRKSFDTLSVVVRDELREDPLSRKVFVFLNRQCDRVKLLYWDGIGIWILAKRLGGADRGAQRLGGDLQWLRLHVQQLHAEPCHQGDGLQRRRSE